MEELLRYTSKDFQPLTMDEWLKDKSPALRPLVMKWFDEIKNCGDDVQAIFHDNCPMGCVDNVPFAYVNAFKAHVNVGFFYGAFLPDRNRVLEGNGKRMRHIKLKPEALHSDAEIRAFIKAAYVDVQKRIY